MLPVQIPGSLSGTARVERIDPVLTRYERCRRLDLEHAIQWNRLHGKALPEVPQPADKDLLIKYCEIYQVDLGLCQTYTDGIGNIRISPPPREQHAKPALPEVTKPDKQPSEMNAFQLKAHLKKIGIEVPADVTKRDDMLKLLAGADGDTP